VKSAFIACICLLKASPRERTRVVFHNHPYRYIREKGGQQRLQMRAFDGKGGESGRDETLKSGCEEKIKNYIPSLSREKTGPNSVRKAPYERRKEKEGASNMEKLI